MKKKIMVLIPSIVIVLIIVLSIANTNETQLYTSNIDSVDGLAFYTQKEVGSTEYNSVDTIPGKNDGYIFKEAVCNDNSNLTFNSSDWSISIENMVEGKVRCKLYFDKENAPAKEYILSHIDTINTRTDFSTTLTTSTTGVIYEEEDDYGTTYYYAGASEDNYFKFAGFWWRIIRINGDNTVRLIYAGKESDYTTGLANGYDDSTTLYETIGANAYNTTANGQRYVGFYHAANQIHGTTDISNIATQLNNWYSTNLIDYEEYISQNTLFCNDRTSYSSESGGSETTSTSAPLYFGAYIRLQTNKNPTFKCSNTNDTFTKNIDNTFGTTGNGILTYPVGLITADEVSFAGGLYNNSNSNYYLYTNTVVWTMTPAKFETSSPRVWHIGSPGGLNYNNGLVNTTRQTRPVINIKADVELEGSGTATDPYQLSV